MDPDRDSRSTSTAPTSPSFSQFISTRCRSYVVHEANRGTLVEGRADHGCNVYASGEHQYVECIMVRAGEEMLKWLGRLSAGVEGAEERWEMPMSISEPGIDVGNEVEKGKEKEEGMNGGDEAERSHERVERG
jgi:hypothetical protein